MYCVHCGAEGVVRFCPQCGKSPYPLAEDSSSVAAPLAEDASQTDDLANRSNGITSDRSNQEHWIDSIYYELVLSQEAARERISDAASDSKAKLTGSDLLALFDAVSPIGLSLSKVVDVIVPIYDKLGIRTKHQSHARVQGPAGLILLSALTTLARQSLTIDSVHQQPASCSMIANLPMGFVTNRGQLLIALRHDDHAVRIDVATTISGQWYDWGRSKRMTDQILQSMGREFDQLHQRFVQPQRSSRTSA